MENSDFFAGPIKFSDIKRFSICSGSVIERFYCDNNIKKNLFIGHATRASHCPYPSPSSRSRPNCRPNICRIRTSLTSSSGASTRIRRAVGRATGCYCIRTLPSMRHSLRTSRWPAVRRTHNNRPSATTARRSSRGRSCSIIR